MPIPRHAKRRDANEPDIVATFEEYVDADDIIRIDVPCDLIVGFRGYNLLFEVKNPDRLQGNRDPRTKAQRELADFAGYIHFVETPEDVRQYMDALIAAYDRHLASFFEHLKGPDPE